MNKMKIFNLVYKIKKIKNNKNCEKRSGGSSVNDICFNKIKFLKLLPSWKSVNPLQRSYLKQYTLELHFMVIFVLLFILAGWIKTFL